MRLRAGLIAVACVLASTIASAQALTSLASVRVGYNTRKTTVQPQGELKTQIEALDRDIAEATRLGRTGELRRLYAKGVTLLAGQPWTDVADYAGSLVIRAERVVVDSSRPYFVRLEQIYSPSIQLERAVKAHVVLRTRPAPPVPAPPLRHPHLCRRSSRISARLTASAVIFGTRRRDSSSAFRTSGTALISSRSS
jgi:hypothetical protein